MPCLTRIIFARLRCGFAWSSIPYIFVVPVVITTTDPNAQAGPKLVFVLFIIYSQYDIICIIELRKLMLFVIADLFSITIEMVLLTPFMGAIVIFKQEEEEDLTKI